MKRFFFFFVVCFFSVSSVAFATDGLNQAERSVIESQFGKSRVLEINLISSEIVYMGGVKSHKWRGFVVAENKNSKKIIKYKLKIFFDRSVAEGDQGLRASIYDNGGIGGRGFFITDKVDCNEASCPALALH